MRLLRRTIYAFPLVISLSLVGRGEAGTYATTVSADSVNTRDATLFQGTPTLNTGSSPDLLVQASKSTGAGHAIIDFTLPDLTGMTVLEAQLRLKQFDAAKPKPVAMTVYPLAEAFTESQATWNLRNTGVPWSTPGGTHPVLWSDRRVASKSTIGNQISWEVGAILSAYQTGVYGISGSGFLLSGETRPPDRSISFRSSDYAAVAADRPQLDLVYTDEAPAVRGGLGEVTPTAVPALQPASLTFYVETDMAGTTPSGNPTGVDRVQVRHGGTLQVTGLSRLKVGGTVIPTAGVTWTDDGTAFTVNLPQLFTQSGRIEITVVANVLVPSTADEITLPILVRNSATGAGYQALWPGNADGIPGNGDDWVVKVFNTSSQIFVRSVSAPATAEAGDTGLPVRVRVESQSPDTVLVEGIDFFFTRNVRGDANPDFAITPSPANPTRIFPGTSASFGFLLDVDPATAPGTVTVDAQGVVTEEISGNVLADTGADTVAVMTVSAPLPITVSASQSPFTVLPASPDLELLSFTVTDNDSGSATLQQVAVDNATQGPGSQAELDAELGTLTLYRDNGNGTFEPASDVPLASGTMSGGSAVFTGLSVVFSPGSSRRFFVAADLPIAVRDGDALDLRLGGPGSLTLSRPPVYSNSWPLDPPGSFPVDGMAAAQVTINPLAGGSLAPGTDRTVVLDAVLPADGYQADVLHRMNVLNLGTAQAGTDLERVELWSESSGAGFDPAQDVLIGPMQYTGNRWEITGVSTPVPVGGLRVYVTVDTAPSAVPSRSVRFSIPTGDDYGLGMESGNSGPLDASVDGNASFTVILPDRVLLAGDPVPSGIARPGEDAKVLLKLTVTNTYSSSRTLTALTVANTGTGTGTQADLDGEITLLTLRRDGNGNGIVDDPSVDPVRGTAVFSGGKARFGGTALSLAPGATEHLFVTADVSVSGAADGDRLSASVAGALGVEFAEPTSVAASWPVTSGGSLTVDGMSAAELTVNGGGTAAAGPGDGPVLALDVTVPRNGYRDDVLYGFKATNQGSAGASDLTAVRLWRDGGDGVFGAGAGDDVDLGALTWVGDGWQSLSMNVPLGAAGVRLFVGATVSAAFGDSADLRLAVPVNGITVASGNDGPVDAAAPGSIEVSLSDAPLLGSMQILPAASVVGGDVTVRLTLTNQGTETISGIVPAPLTVAGTGSLAPLTGPTPASNSLPPGGSGSFQWTLRGTGAGTVSVSGSAQGVGTVSGVPRASRLAVSPPHSITEGATEVLANALEFMPFAVTLGQGDVVPLSLTFTNPGNTLTSDVLLTRLRFRIEDENGQGIVPSALLSRVVAGEGRTVFADKSSLETSGSTVDLLLGSPFTTPRVRSLDPVTLSLQLFVAPNTSVSRFRIVIPDSTWITAGDAVSGSPVPVVLESGTFPLQTGLATLVAQATRVDVAHAAGNPLTAGPGQGNISLLDLTLTNPSGSIATSSVRVGSIAVLMTDGSGLPVTDAATWLSRLDVQAGGQTVGSLDLPPAGGDSLVFSFSPPLPLAAGTPVPVSLRGTVAANAPPGTIRLALADPATFQAVDDNTGETVPAIYAAPPVEGPVLTVQAPAVSLLAGGLPRFPAAVTVGESDLAAFTATLEHPGVPGTAPIRLDTLSVTVRDDRGQVLIPRAYLDRVRLLRDGVEIASTGSMPSTSSPIRLPLAGQTLNAGEVTELALEADLDAAAPQSLFQITAYARDLSADDANLGTAVAVSPRGGSEFPITSGLTQVRLPAREAVVGLASALPAVLAADGSEVSAGTFSFTNPSPDGSATVEFRYLRLEGSDRSYSPVPVGAAAATVALYKDGTLWVRSAPLTPDSASVFLPFPQPLDVDPGRTKTIEVRMEIAAGATASTFRLGCASGGIGLTQPAGSALAVELQPEAGASFPLWTESGTLGSMSLGKSYANFPNPFAAGREQTNFTFYLRADARVTLEVYTLRGEKVATVIGGELRPAGLYQDDRWDGRNLKGSVVLSGVYVARLEVNVVGGSTERLLRKVAVVR